MSQTSPQKTRSLIEKAVDEIRRIELLLKSLLNFAKPPQLQLLQTDVNDLLDKDHLLFTATPLPGRAGLPYR